MSLIEALRQPLFEQYRKSIPFNSNYLQPCPCLDNPEKLRKIVNEAKALLMGTDQMDLSRVAYRNEYNLLMAKILSGSGRLEEALGYCTLAIDGGRECNEHYASEAALVAGDIESRLGNRQKAIRYYNLALEIRGQNDVYIEIIGKMAKSRLKNL